MLKEKIKKSLSLLMVFSVLLIGLSPATVNAQKDTQNEVITYNLPDEVIEENFKKQIDEYLQNLITLTDRSYYSTETVAIKNGMSSYGDAGGQPRDGYEFPYGGSFAWKDGSGPSLDVSVTIEKERVSFTVNLGEASTSGVAHVNVNVPGPGWYKLRTARSYQVRKVHIYKHHSDGTKELWDVITPHEVTGVSFQVVKTR
ncbi:hypothetical protein [Tepidimicrobium xylanilyticum]|uniref:Uncharacterized protein n=1 Tax=Tepidimicrobium xylanilyticum TaxID=1123352 RepID=A0A1H3DLK2_9FIRM|nr:hypothetical protein [Tepidimicrobium xylanilyticum]GMG98151.1 hypothetical protein EN5CB1_29770 [Tepidimicrobium xylanilyticum]SDX66554.1 hypothetical protein SAMN05660923_02701 [Tepidimicrobium xylanilyticum]